MWTLKNQNCALARAKYRWLSVDRGGATNGWHKIGRTRVTDEGDGDSTITTRIRQVRNDSR